MFSARANYTKLKTNLRLCVQRLKLLEKKKSELALKSRREIADYIAAGKEDRARIRVEHIIREDYMVEALEILELFCDLLLARFGLIETMATVDEGLHEAIASLIWATPRLQGDIPEFTQVSKQLTAKYSIEFADACRKNEEKVVNTKLEHKLSVHAPPRVLVERYMMEIAKSYNVPFEPDEAALRDERPGDSCTSNLIDLCPDGQAYNKANEAYGGLPALPPIHTGPNAPHGGYQYPPPPSTSSGGSYPPPPPGVATGSATYTSDQSMYPPPENSHAPAWSTANGPNLPAYNAPSHPASSSGSPSPPPAYTTNPHFPTHRPPGSGGGGGTGGGGGVRNMQDTLPELPSVPTPRASFNQPGMNSAGGEDVDFDELTRRFEELKKKK